MKKIIFTVLALVGLSTAFADNYSMNATSIIDVPTATSFTNKTTSGIFSTDVDNFMSVKDYNTVAPEKFFGYAGYNYNNSTGFNFGFAKQLKKFYLGWYFGGQLDGFSMQNKFSDKSDANKLEYTYNADATKTYTGSLLLGFEKFAVKSTLLYNPVNGAGSVSSVKDKDNNETTVDKDVYDIYADVQVAFPGKARPHFEVGLDSWVAKYYANKEGYADKSVYDLYLRGGFSKDLNSEDETFTHGFDFDFDTRWRITPMVQNQNDKGKDEHFGAADNMIQATAAYNATLEASDRLTLGAKVAVPLQVGMVWAEDYSKAIDGDKVYNTARKFYTDIGFAPKLDLGATFAVAKDKVNFNLGTSIAMGEIGWNIVGTQNRKSSSESSIDSTDTTVKFGFDSADFSTKWNAGFTAFFGEKVTLDASYNILENLNNNSIDYSSQSDIWGTAQKIFVHKLEFLVSVKL